MPLYEYECNVCHQRFERRQKVTDDPVSICPSCSGAVRRVIHPVGIIFKGSGFYVTDNRKGDGVTASTGDGGAGDKAAAKTGDTPAKSDGEKPAAASGDSGTKSESTSKPAESSKTSENSKPAASTAS